MVMVSDKAQYRYEVLRFWEKYGLAPTLEAFKLKRRTLYYWRGQVRIDGGDLEALNEKSRAPGLKRKRLGPKEVTEEIRRLRTLYPNLSKEKLYLFVKLFCEQRKLSCPQARTIARIIADEPDKMRSRPIKVRSNGQRIERKKSPRAENPKATKPALLASAEPSTRWSTF
jgi:hypothetical protein